LVALARRFVTLSEELDQVRDEIRRCVMNGAGGDSVEVRPPSQPGAAPAKAKRSSARALDRAALMAEAREADEAVLAIVRAHPGVKTGEVRRETKQRASTLSERLRRLVKRGLVERGADGAWTATASV
jgi:hypothetical protein